MELSPEVFTRQEAEALVDIQTKARLGDFAEAAITITVGWRGSEPIERNYTIWDAMPWAEAVMRRDREQGLTRAEYLKEIE